MDGMITRRLARMDQTRSTSNEFNALRQLMLASVYEADSLFVPYEVWSHIDLSIRSHPLAIGVNSMTAESLNEGSAWTN